MLLSPALLFPLGKLCNGFPMELHFVDLSDLLHLHVLALAEDGVGVAPSTFILALFAHG